MSTTTQTSCLDRSSPTSWVYLERRPDSPYKQLMVKNTNFSAMKLCLRHKDTESPESAEEIARSLDLPVDAVKEAIAYGESCPPEVKEDRRLDEERVRQRLHEACHVTMCAGPHRWPWEYLERNPSRHYRQFVIKGKRIRAWSLYCDFNCDRQPETLGEIAADWDLPLEAVVEAVAYCSVDPPEIREDWEMEEASVKAAGQEGAQFHARAS